MLSTTKNDKSSCVVRVTTTYWSDSRGLHVKKSLNYLRRKSYGYNILEEDAKDIGAADVITEIVNLDKVEDGIYEVIICGISTDWETGYVDDYDYKLIPFEVKAKE